jgi:hypothetical protein
VVVEEEEEDVKEVKGHIEVQAPFLAQKPESQLHPAKDDIYDCVLVIQSCLQNLVRKTRMSGLHNAKA